MAYLPPGGGRMNVTIGSNTAGVGALISTGTLALAGGNNITLSQNGANGLTIHGGAAAGAAISAGGASASNGTIAFSNSNNVSFGMNGSTVTASASFNQTVQTQSNIQAVYDGANSISTGTIRYSNSNGISFGINGQTLTASHNGLTSQSAQTANLYVSSNSTQLSSTAGVDLRSLSFQGAGIASVGVSQGKVLISVPAGGGGAGVAFANSETTYTSGTVNLVGDGQVTVYSAANQSYRISMPGTSSISATGAFNISSNGATISMGVPAFSAGISNLGNSLGTSGTISNQLIFAGGNNITLSQSTNTAGNTLTIQGAGGAGLSAGTQSVNTGTVNFANSNGITFGMSGSNQITASHNGLTTQSNQAVSANNGSFAFQTLSFSNANGISFGTSAGSALTASYTVPAQSNQTMGFSAGGNTSLTSAGTFDARNMYLNALGAASVGFSNSSMFISAPTQSAQTQSVIQGIVASGSTNRTGDISFANSNGVTFGLSNNTVTASISTPTGLALANSQTSFNSGTVNLLEGGGAITIASTTGQKFSFSVPATSQLSATGAISISTNGNVISIGAPVVQGMPTLSRFEAPVGGFSSLSTQGQGSLSIVHDYIPFNVVMSAAKIGGSITVGTSTAAATGSVNLSLWMGIYTLTGSTLSLAASGSANNGFSWQAASASSSALNASTVGMRQLTVPMGYTSNTAAAYTATPGEYWVAAALSTATTLTNMTFSVYGNPNIVTAASNAILTPIGSGSANARDAYLFQGIYTAATAAGPASMSGGHINNYSSGYVMRANFYHALYNATY